MTGIQYLTHQEIFDKAAKGVIAQGELSMNGGNTCLYIHERALEGRKLHCGVGHLLTDDNMCQRWDAYGWTMADVVDILSNNRSAKAAVIEDMDKSRLPHDAETLELLQEIQNAHDGSDLTGRPIVDFIEEMRCIATARHLDPAVLNA